MMQGRWIAVLDVCNLGSQTEKLCLSGKEILEYPRQTASSQLKVGPRLGLSHSLIHFLIPELEWQRATKPQINELKMNHFL